MSRSVHADLVTASQSNNRKPLQRLTVRNRRLDFTESFITTNPWSANDQAQIGGRDYVFGASVSFGTGEIMRLWGANGLMKTNRVTDPSVDAQWSNWTSLTFTGGGGTLTADAYSNPGLLWDNEDLHAFYVQGGVLKRTTFLPGSDEWTAPEVTDATGFSTTCKICPVSLSAVFVVECITKPSTTQGYLRFSFVTGIGDGPTTTIVSPYQLHDNSGGQLTSPAHDYVTFATAIAAPTFTGLIFYDAGHKRTYFQRYSQEGVFYPPRLLFPGDGTTIFRPYHISYYNNQMWLTGNVIRPEVYSDEQAYGDFNFDAVLRSWNGAAFTSMDRDSFVTGGSAADTRGKVLLAGDYAYYVGIRTVFRAPATYLIDGSDPVDQKITIGDDATYADLLGGRASYPSSGTGSTLSFDVANGDESYYNSPKADVFKSGSDITLELGYATVSGNRYVTMFEGAIDSIQRATMDGKRSLSVSSRDQVYRSLKDWKSLFFYEFMSQEKHYDDCDKLDKLYPVDGGNWTTKSPNLITNSGFETNQTGWGYIALSFGPSPKITITRSSDEAYTGDYSLRLIRQNGGGATEEWGTQTAITVVANKPYTASAKIKITAISGGTKEIKLRAKDVLTGTVYQTTTHLDVTSGWEDLTCAFTPTNSGTVAIQVLYSNATAGTMYVDDATCYCNSTGYIRYNTMGEGRFLFSTTPFDTDRFDIQTTFEINGSNNALVTAAALVGLATDTDNLILLQVARLESGTSYLQLYKRRSRVWTQLASVSVTHLSTNTKYKLRFIYQFGRFQGFLRADSNPDWGTAVIDHYWTQPEAPCLSVSGLGKVGLRAMVDANSFHAYGINDKSEAICLRRDNDLKWSSFPASGMAVWDNEIITYSARTGSNIQLYNGAFHLEWDPDNLGSVRDTAESFPSDPTTRIVDYWNYGWRPVAEGGIGDPHYAAYEVASQQADNYLINYGVLFPDSSKPNTSWYIDDSVGEGLDIYGAGTQYAAVFHCADSGNTEYGRSSPTTAIPDGASDLTLVITPCLVVSARGQNNTTAESHADDTLVYQYTDSSILVYDFSYYDTEDDENTETLIRKIAALAGVNTEFHTIYDSLVTYPPYGVIALGSGEETDDLCEFGGTYRTENFDLSFVTYVATNDKSFVVNMAYSPTDYHRLRFKRVDNFTLEVSLERVVSGTPTALEKSSLTIDWNFIQVLEVRVVRSGAFVTAYIMGDCALFNFHNTDQKGASVGLSLEALDTPVSFAAVVIPELRDWREAVRLDAFRDAMSGLQEAIRDRDVSLVARSGTTLLASTFLERADAGTLPDVIVTDQDWFDIGQVVTHLHINCEDIVESVSVALAYKYGLISTELSMPTADIYQAKAVGRRILQHVEEQVEGHRISGAADLRLEPEDKFTADYIASGTGRAVTGDFVINSLDITFGPASMVMNIEAKKYVDYLI